MLRGRSRENNDRGMIADVIEDVGWTGPLCPACSEEMNAGAVETQLGLGVVQRCPSCDLTMIVRDPFGIGEST
jgi:hypothetical protein